MIARLGPDNILHRHGCYILLSHKQERSWFSSIRSICSQYGLPDPLLTLQSPQSKESWKKLTKAKVTDFWEERLRIQASVLSSLEYFDPNFMSLTKPHPLFLAANSPFEVKKAVVVARMLSGRYRTDRLVRHWSNTNPAGLCKLPGCAGDKIGDLQHILLYCSALEDTRLHLSTLWANFMLSRPYLFPIITNLISQERSLMQLLLDPSSLPQVISANQENSDVLPCCFYLSRTWVYSIHLKRSKLQKQFNLL